MLRNLLIATYIIAVLVISSMARANGTAEILDIQHQPGSMMVKITGLYSDGCFAKLEPVVLDSATIENEVSVVLSEGETKSLCANPASELRPFEMALDLKDLNLPSGRDYVIHFRDEYSSEPASSLEVFIPQSAQGLGYQGTELKGELIAMANSEYAVVDHESQTAVAVRSVFSLDKYIGKQVALRVVELKHQAAPVAEVNSPNLLLAPKLGPDANSFVVFVSSSIAIDDAPSWF